MAPGASQTPVGLPDDADPEVQSALAEGLTKLINEMTIRFAPLDYDYAEDLLTQIDTHESYLAGGEQGEPARFMPGLDAREEVDHFRETIRRWESARDKEIRPEIDALKAEVARRDPGGLPRFYPEFQKRFSASFDDFIRHETAHMHELRNRAIHKEAATLFDPYRADHPDLIRYYESTLDRQYPLPDSSTQAGQTGSDAA